MVLNNAHLFVPKSRVRAGSSLLTPFNCTFVVLAICNYKRLYTILCIRTLYFEKDVVQQGPYEESLEEVMSP